MFENVYKRLCSENYQLNINHFSIISNFITVGLELRRNDEVNTVIEIGLKIAYETVYSHDDSLTIQSFFDVCASAFSTTRNLDSAIKLLRKVEQIQDATFSVMLFANVLE
jgi:hypothetical protein